MEAIRADVEEVVDQPRHLRDLAVDHLERPLSLRNVRCSSVQDLGGAPDRRERVTKLVGERREELVLRPIRVLEDVLDLLAVADVDEHVDRPEQSTPAVPDGIGVGERRQPLPVGPLDDDLVAVVLAVRRERLRHPALVVSDRLAVGREQLEGAAEAVDRVVQLRASPPELRRVLVEVGDEPVGVARVGARGQFFEQLPELGLSLDESEPGPGFRS